MHHRGTAMDHFAGIDVSLELSSVCVVDATGRIVREAKVASEPAEPPAYQRLTQMCAVVEKRECLPEKPGMCRSLQR